MARPIQLTTVLLISACVAACALFDSGMPWRSGPYALMWIDLPDEVLLGYDEGAGSWTSLVEPRVFAVGADDRYVVVQQHPNGDGAVTSFFIVDRRANVPKRPKAAVTGPLTEREFRDKAASLRLPAFTKVLESLK